MNFGQALEALKDGEKVARQGWNGKGMWIIYISGGVYEHEDHGEFESSPCLLMKTAQNTVSMGWRPTNQDMFMEDWYVVE